MSNRLDPTMQALLRLDPRVVAQTPADVIYQEHKLRLLHYRPVVEQRVATPLLIIPSVLTRYYMLDLLPGNSLVEYLVRRGIDVYLLDWGAHGPEDRIVTFDQYVIGYVRRCVQQVRKHAGQAQISTLGYSLGGTFAVIFTALYGQYFRNLVPIAAPVNFHDEGLLSQWTRKGRYNVDLVVDTVATLPLPLMQASFRLLKPSVHLAQQIALAQMCGDMDLMEDFLVMQNWLTDTTPWLGEAYRTYVKECYQANHLVQNKLIVGGRRVDLTQIACSLLTITATKDQLCLPRSAAVLNDLVQSTDQRVLQIAGGHVAIVAARNAASAYWSQLADWLVMRSG